ncbi:MAG: hypothetical protein GW886_04075 [Rhodobacterales bacterium]|nr:hypothetical protein [Rhodobacterales bacterium]NCT12234.1 hypothetical protein [Rhodobacterales bacterium]
MSSYAAFAFCLALAVPLAAAPVAAQEGGEDGMSLMEQGAQLFLRGLASEVEPALNDFRDLAQEMEPAIRGFATEMGPRLMELMALVDDLKHYSPPEMLDNGDIIIRRRADAPPYAPPKGEPIDL